MTLKQKFTGICAIVVALIAFTMVYDHLTLGQLNACDGAEGIEAINIATSLIVIMLALCVPVFARTQLLTPQEKIIAAMRDIAAEKLDTPVPYTDRRDEIGEMARALDIFRKNAEENRRLEKEGEDLKRHAEEERRHSLLSLAGNFKSNVKSVADTVASAATEMDATSRDVMKLAQDGSEKLVRLVSGISGASQNMQTIASAAIELSASIREISQQVSHGGKIMAAAVHEAERADGASAALNEAAEKIGGVVDVITEITAQVNLLALNATIEAARAGDQGKGFAVVAAEVKSLAGQTATATRQIEDQISFIQSTAADTVGAIQQISATITEMNKISASIAAAVEEQGAATQEIVRNVQEAAETAKNVSSNANDVRETSSGGSAAVRQMIAGAADLSRQSESLRGQVENFLKDIKAG